MYSAGSSANGDELLVVPPVLESSESESPVLELSESEDADSAVPAARSEADPASDSAVVQPHVSNAAKTETEEEQEQDNDQLGYDMS